MRKNPEANLKLRYKKVFELSLVIVLVLMVVLFQLLRIFKLEAKDTTTVDVTIEVEDIPQTEQIKVPPPPPKPSIPIPTESEDVPEDVTIDATDFVDLSQIPPPPAPIEDEATIFVAYDEPPQPIGGFGAIQKVLKYPEIARKVGIEGRVIVHVLVSRKGDVVQTKILRSLGHSGCDEAAVSAIKSVKWKPALQRDKPVKVWVSIPVIFKLK